MFREALAAFAQTSAALQALGSWRRRNKGDARALIIELEENYTHLRMVAFNDAPLRIVIGDLAVAEYKRLAREGFNFNELKRKRIKDDLSFEGTQLKYWAGKAQRN